MTVHGRTRACGFTGVAEHDTAGEVKTKVNIPVIANGDIDSPEKAAFVLAYTKADAVMIGRAAQGRPWIFGIIDHYLKTGEILSDPPVTEIRDVMLEHLGNLYEFYGEYTGVRIARKHISWYSKRQPGGAAFRQAMNRIEDAAQQLTMAARFFDQLADELEVAA